MRRTVYAEGGQAQGDQAVRLNSLLPNPEAPCTKPEEPVVHVGVTVLASTSFCLIGRKSSRVLAESFGVLWGPAETEA